MKDLINKLQAIAEANPLGFTVTLPNCKPVQSGWAIGMIETQNSHGRKGLKKALEISLATTKVFGGWKGYNGKFYFDAVIIEHDDSKAYDLKYENQQLGIYNIGTGRVI